MSGAVQVSAIGSGEYVVGHLTLDAPNTLNALTLDMVEIMAKQLLAWRDDPTIAAVLIDGVGEKAFCAGGDVQALRNSSIENPGGPCEYAETFFAREYRMNYILHTYPKPIICWGHGVVMGGGLGILAGCSHRVVSERTRIGMPEITIGLFPDVGGSWFLNNMPGEVGRFLALTAANINATDALFCGLGNHFLGHDQKPWLIDELAGMHWQAPSEHHEQVTDLLSVPATQPKPDAQVEPALTQINALVAGDDLAAIVERTLAWEGDNPWLAKARDGLAHGSKLAASWIFRQLNESRARDLRAVFESELRLGANIMRYPEFAEGVRALLVDKDRQPKWAYRSVADVPSTLLDTFFEEPAGAPLIDFPDEPTS